jgi:lysyl-tRNA synthetase class I
MGLDKDDIKQLIAILQRGLSDDDDDDDFEEAPVKPKAQTKSKKKKFKNLFDNMAESSMHKDDVEIDKRLRVQPPTQRSRNYKPLQVMCRVCGKTEKVNPGLVESVERYKCNKCSTSAG